MGIASAAREGSSGAYVLRARFHDGHRSELRFSGERTRIGSRGAELVLGDTAVCPLHAELIFRDGVVGVRYLGSGRCTWVDGKRVDRAVLRPGMWFRVGQTNFVLVDVGRPARAVYDALLRRGVIVRPFGNLPTNLRVTFGLPEENDRFLSSLREVLA